MQEESCDMRDQTTESGPERGVQPVKTITRSADLTPDPRNANRGTPRGREMLASSLADLGAGRSIVVDRDGVIIAGNKTHAAAAGLDLPVSVVRTAGDTLVVVQRTDLDLSTDQRARKLAVVDNRSTEVNLEWDPEALKTLIADGLDVNDLWFESELRKLLGDAPVDASGPFEPRATDIRVGECFELGAHRVFCGDATDPEAVRYLLANDHPRLMATDPPYGVDYDPAWRARALPTQRTAIGAVKNDDQVDWTAALRHFPGDVAYVWHAGLHAGTVATTLEQLDFQIRAQIIWSKQHFTLSRGDYHWQHEPCWYAVRRGRASAWSGDRGQSTVWQVANLNPIGAAATPENAVTGHATQKPVELFERPIRNHTRPGEAIYEPFAGSGTALIAAERTQRRCLALELDPRYVQAIIDRWQMLTGRRAVKIGDAPVAADTP
jgi:DNA modification methylase